ncbi:MAG: hypothetical protein QOH48_179 [Actinomycetota bacterium]|jgi:hypothetical protein|nr:hypothetical protein [Actinomycetota bacterium]
MDNELTKAQAEVQTLIDTEQRLHEVLRKLAAKETEGVVEWLTPPLESAITDLELARDKLESAHGHLGDALRTEENDS